MGAVTDVAAIRTPRFELVSMSLPFMQTLLAGDIAAAEAEIGATIPPDLADQLDHFLQFRIADLTVDPSAQPWLGRAIVRTGPDGSRRVIGTCGSIARPTPRGGSRSATPARGGRAARAPRPVGAGGAPAGER